MSRWNRTPKTRRSGSPFAPSRRCVPAWSRSIWPRRAACAHRRAGAAGPSARARRANPRIRRAHVDLQAGAALLTSLDGVGPALMPVVRSAGARVRGWCCKARWPDSGAAPTVDVGGRQRARRPAIRRARRLLRASAAPALFSPTSRSRPACCARRSTVRRIAPADAHFVERWSFLLDGSLGARLRLPGRYHLTLAAHVQVAEPYVAIHFVDTLVATSGHPNLGSEPDGRRVAVTSRRRAARLAVIGVLAASSPPSYAGCARADVYPITGAPTRRRRRRREPASDQLFIARVGGRATRAGRCR